MLVAAAIIVVAASAEHMAPGRMGEEDANSKWWVGEGLRCMNPLTLVGTSRGPPWGLLRALGKNDPFQHQQQACGVRLPPSQTSQGHQPSDVSE